MGCTEPSCHVHPLPFRYPSIHVSFHSLHAGRLLLRAGRSQLLLCFFGVSKLVFRQPGVMLFGRVPNKVSRGRYLMLSPELGFKWCLAFSHPLLTSTYTQRLRTTSQSLASQKRCVRNPYTRCRKGSFETAKSVAKPRRGQRLGGRPQTCGGGFTVAPSVLTCTTCTLEKIKVA